MTLQEVVLELFRMLDLECQILRTEGLGQLLVVFTAAAGSRAAEQLRELSVVHAK